MIIPVMYLLRHGLDLVKLLDHPSHIQSDVLTVNLTEFDRDLVKFLPDKCADSRCHYYSQISGDNNSGEWETSAELPFIFIDLCVKSAPTFPAQKGFDFNMIY